jgi:serine/threonine protein kinase
MHTSNVLVTLDKICKQIGKGQSGFVYLQDDNASVVKVCRTEKHFKRELKWLKKAQDAPFAIKLLGHDEQTLSLTLEYVPHTLEDLIVSKQLDNAQKQEIQAQLLEFLEAPRSWVHNDFKAKNILITDLDKPIIRIIDFDLAKSSKNKEIDYKKFRVLQTQLENDMSYKEALKTIQGKCNEFVKGI